MSGFPFKHKLTAGTASVCLGSALLLGAAPGHGPKLNPVAWSLSAGSGSFAPGSTVVLHLHAQVADDYHLYSLTTPSGGPIKTVIGLTGEPGLDQVRVFQPAPKRYNDPVLGIPVETFSGTVDFPIEVHLAKSLAAGSRMITVYTRYQSCSSEICLPPADRTAKIPITITSGSTETKESVPSTFQFVTGEKSPASN